MMMLAGIVFTIAIWGTIGLAFGSIAYFLRNWTFRPIAIPKDEEFIRLFKRERFLTMLLFTVLFVSPMLWIIGLGVLVITYAMGIYRHLKSRLNPQLSIGTSAPFPLIPRFSLSDLMAMVFSFGCAPAILLPIPIEHSSQHVAIVAIFSVALVTFPACFLCVLYRLECNQVPAGVPRMACVAIGPYVLLGSLAILPLTIAILINLSFNGSEFAVLAIYLSIAIVILIAGRVLAAMSMTAAQGRAAAELPMNQ